MKIRATTSWDTERLLTGRSTRWAGSSSPARIQDNYSENIGNAVAAGLSNVYHALEDRTLGRNLGTYGMLDMWDGVSNLMKEFWPDIHRKIQHKHNQAMAREPDNPSH